jgi:hypothetical protein
MVVSSDMLERLSLRPHTWLGPWHDEITIAATAGGHLDIVRYAVEHGCPVPPGGFLTGVAAINGRLAILKYLHEELHSEWHDFGTSNAALAGHLDCLIYAHEHGCPWGQLTCLWAAKQGHLECLRYAHENGAQWDEAVCSAALANGHLHCVQYAHENGVPCSHNTSRDKQNVV